VSNDAAYARLSININTDTEAEIRHLMQRDGINATEAVRRLIGYGAIVDRTICDNGDLVLLDCGDSGRYRLHLLTS
jgi:hypothetical protein